MCIIGVTEILVPQSKTNSQVLKNVLYKKSLSQMIYLKTQSMLPLEKREGKNINAHKLTQ